MKDRSPFLFSGPQAAKVVFATMKYFAGDLKNIHKQLSTRCILPLAYELGFCFLTIGLVLDCFSWIIKKGHLQNSPHMNLLNGP